MTTETYASCPLHPQAKSSGRLLRHFAEELLLSLSVPVDVPLCVCACVYDVVTSVCEHIYQSTWNMSAVAAT